MTKNVIINVIRFASYTVLPIGTALFVFRLYVIFRFPDPSMFQDFPSMILETLVSFVVPIIILLFLKPSTRPNTLTKTSQVSNQTLPQRKNKDQTITIMISLFVFGIMLTIPLIFLVEAAQKAFGPK